MPGTTVGIKTLGFQSRSRQRRIETCAVLQLLLQVSLDPPWQALLDQTVSDAERELVKLLAAHSGLPVPELGHETEDGSVLDLAWPDQRIAVVLDPESVDTASLIADGWQLCGADVPTVVERLLAAGRI